MQSSDPPSAPDAPAAPSHGRPKTQDPAYAAALALIRPRNVAPPEESPAPDPVPADGPKRRGRPPKKQDANYFAARAAITGAAKAPGHPAQPAALRAKRPYHRRVFQKIPGPATGQPLDLDTVRAIIKPRAGTTRREWPLAPVGPKAPPLQLTPEERQQIINFYTERYGAILSLDQAADVAKLSKQTLRRYVCEGCFADAVYRGRPLRFITHRFVPEVLR